MGVVLSGAAGVTSTVATSELLAQELTCPADECKGEFLLWMSYSADKSMGSANDAPLCSRSPQGMTGLARHSEVLHQVHESFHRIVVVGSAGVKPSSDRYGERHPLRRARCRGKRRCVRPQRRGRAQPVSEPGPIQGRARQGAPKGASAPTHRAAIGVGQRCARQQSRRDGRSTKAIRQPPPCSCSSAGSRSASFSSAPKQKRAAPGCAMTKRPYSSRSSRACAQRCAGSSCGNLLKMNASHRGPARGHA